MQRTLTIVAVSLTIFPLFGKPTIVDKPDSAPWVGRLLSFQKVEVKKVEQLLAAGTKSYEESIPIDVKQLGLISGAASMKRYWRDDRQASDSVAWTGRNYYISTALEINFDSPLKLGWRDAFEYDSNISAAIKALVDDSQKILELGFKPDRMKVKRLELRVQPQKVGSIVREVLSVAFEVEFVDVAGNVKWEGKVYYERRFKSLKDVEIGTRGQSLNSSSPDYDFTRDETGRDWSFAGSNGS